MLGLENPWLIALSIGFAILAGACFASLLRTASLRRDIRKRNAELDELRAANAECVAGLQMLVRARDELSETQRFMEALQQLTELLQLCESDTESRQIIEQGGILLFPRWSGALTFADDNGMMEVAAGWGEPFTDAHVEEGDCWAVRRGRLHQISADLRSPALAPVCSHFGGGPALPPGMRHAICAPLLKSFDRPGALHLVAREAMSEEDLQAAAWGAETLANALKLSLGNLRLRTSLREQAVRDVLTNLYNRRYFNEALNRELSRSQRTGDGLVLAILDIDHFKTFNDSFGHEAGDQVLKTIADQLRCFVRAYDIACRVGGEELAIIIPRVHIDEAYGRLDQLREKIGCCALTRGGVQLPAITVSIGLAELEPDGGSAEDLLRRADVALYAAKSGGRNCVRRWTADLEAA